MIKEKPTKIECPNCKKCTLPIVYPKSVCANCGKKYKWHELQRKWQKAFISSGNGAKIDPYEIYESCVECLNHSMIFYKKLGIWVCFSCGNGWEKDELTQCEVCRRYTDGPYINLCSVCWDEGFGTSLVVPDSVEIAQSQLPAKG